MIDQFCAELIVKGACPFAFAALRVLGWIILGGLGLVVLAILARAVWDAYREDRWRT